MEYGDEMEVWDERCLVIANHQTTADVPCIAALLQDKGKAANKVLSLPFPSLSSSDGTGVGEQVCWVIDSSFRWTPFGMCGQVHGDCFVTQGRAKREKAMEALRKNLQNVYWKRDRRWIVVFPEGPPRPPFDTTLTGDVAGNFLYKQRESNQRWAAANGYPVTQHVLLPRYGAVKLALESVGPKENRVGAEAPDPQSPVASLGSSWDC